MGNVRILAFGASLRHGSLNRYLIDAAAGETPPGSEVEFYDISTLPFFNEDDEVNPPREVKKFKEALKNADAVLIASPEYNYSVPGYLKNAIDIASRFGSNSFERKPVAIVGASMSRMGTVRAQYHLRQSFVYLNARVINKPEVFVAAAHEKFDSDGRLTDEPSRKALSELLSELVAEAQLLAASQ